MVAPQTQGPEVATQDGLTWELPNVAGHSRSHVPSRQLP